MDNKILSIVIPTYNIEKYINKCLNSFINKELLPLIEVIVVNDGSKDDSSTIAKKYVQEYPESFHVIDKENGGHGSTINVALKVAKGKFFMVVDGDDWVDNQALLKIVNILKNNLNLDAILFNYVREIQSNHTQEFYSLSNIFNEGRIFLDNANLDIDKQFGLPNTIYNTENLRKINMKLDEKTYYVDVEYMLYPIITIHDAMYINEYVYHYLRGRPNQSVDINTALKHIKDRETVIVNVINYFNKLNLDNISKFALNFYYIKMASVVNDYYYILIVGDKDCSSKMKEFDKMIKSKDEQLYNVISKKYFYINLARKFNYCLPVIKIAHFLDKCLKKIKSIVRGEHR